MSNKLIVFQVLQLTDKLLMKDKDQKGNPELSDVKLLSQLEPPLEKPAVVAETAAASEGEVSLVAACNCKQEDISSAKSDIFDSDSPHYTDGVHSSLLDLEAADSSYRFEPEQSDLSQDEEDNLSKALFHPSYIFPKLEEVDDDYSDPPAASSCNFGFPVEDHAFWSWAY